MSITIQIPSVDEKIAKKLLGKTGKSLSDQQGSALLTSKLVAIEIKKLKDNGVKLSKEDIDKIKFEYDPVFRKSIMKQIRAEYDQEYLSRVEVATDRVRKMETFRQEEINKLAAARWQRLEVKGLAFNLTEGLLAVKDFVVPFSGIKGATIDITESYRLETAEKGKSKKHASLGGAVAGGMLSGGIGAVIGGTALGKTTYKGKTNTDSIPTASNIGVIVTINDFQHKVTVLGKTVDQDSRAFRNAFESAQKIIATLQQLAVTPVPQNVLPVEKEPAILSIDARVLELKNELASIQSNKPLYEVPAKYLFDPSQPVYAEAEESTPSVVIQRKHCRHCGAELPTDKTKYCPVCKSASSKPIYKKWWFWVIIANVILFTFLALMGTLASDEPSTPPTYREVRMQTMFNDLSEGASSAKNLYLGEYVELTGKITYYSSSCIKIKSADTGSSYNTIECRIQNDEQRKFLEEKQKGDIVTIKGKITSVESYSGYVIEIHEVQ